MTVAIRIATFNAGLAVGFLPYSTERLPLIVDALARLDVDLLFVQEFWLEAHWSTLRAAIAERLPDTLRQPAFCNPEHGACSQAEVEPLVICGEARCRGLRDEALAQCAIEHCAATALALSPPCLNCIASHPVGTLHEIVARCVGEGTPFEQPAAARKARYGGLMAYGGSFGTGLLSRWPFLETATTAFESSINARGALYVRVVAPGVGEFSVFATHLSPGGAEQAPQVERLLSFIEHHAGDGPAVLIGDLNTSPGSTLFRQLQRAGFSETDQSDRRATYAANALSNGQISETGWRLDHVLVRGFDAVTRTERILDRPITIDTQQGAVRTTLSDHFGLLATIEPTAKM
jgi:endonuclease/exonuclease/phosphatase family metal-dependent hydrolase